MRRGLALVTVEQQGIARSPGAYAIAGARPMRSTSQPFCRPFSLCRGLRQDTFFRRTLDNCERLIRTPAQASISADPGDRPVWPVGHGFFEQGCCHRQRGFTFHRRRPRRGAGPAHQHRHAQSRGTPGGRCLARTQNASAMRGLVQPESVSNTARALSACPRSRDPASAAKATRCVSLAPTRDFPANQCLHQSHPAPNHKTNALVNQTDSA